MTPIWVLVNCNSIEEAEGIGEILLNKRLASCIDIFRRDKAKYFWPPRSLKIETAKGALLVVDSFEPKYREIHNLVKKEHSDELPFISFIEIKGIEREYLNWMIGEIKK